MGKEQACVSAVGKYGKHMKKKDFQGVPKFCANSLMSV